MVEKNIQERIFELFQALDLDIDGKISRDTIEIEDFPEDFVGVIRPVLFEIAENGNEWDVETFSKAMRRLLKWMSPLEKRVFMKGPFGNHKENQKKIKVEGKGFGHRVTLFTSYF